MAPADAAALAEARVERLADRVAERDVDALLVSRPVNVRYVTGYTGSSGVALVGAGPRALRRFLTDFRYETQASNEVPAEFERAIVAGDLLEEALGTLEGGGRLGFDDAHISVKVHADLLGRLGDGWELVPCGGIVEELREVKDAGELASIRAAAELVDDVLGWIAERGLARRTERQVALDLEHELRVRGAQAPSFASIVASGPHGALPHAQPRDVEIARGVLVTIDTGAIVDGYCSDCTRTFATGPIEDEQREVYELVLRALQAGVDALAPGPTGREVDAAARSVIADAGLGERFGHGLGHGVGLEIHEAPRLSRTAPEVPLRAGNVVTVEPGVYEPGRYGLRIEDLLVVTEDGSELLSHFPRDLITVD